MPLFVSDLDAMLAGHELHGGHGLGAICHPEAGTYLWIAEEPDARGRPGQCLFKLACAACGARGPELAVLARGARHEGCACDEGLWDVEYYNGFVIVRCHTCHEVRSVVEAAPYTQGWGDAWPARGTA